MKKNWSRKIGEKGGGMAVQGAYTFEEGGRRRRKRVEKVKDGNNDIGQKIAKICLCCKLEELTLQRPHRDIEHAI